MLGGDDGEEAAAPEEAGPETLYVEVARLQDCHVAHGPCALRDFLKELAFTYKIRGQTELVLRFVSSEPGSAEQAGDGDAVDDLGEGPVPKLSL